MKYIKLEENIIQRNNKDGSVSFIPMTEENADYREYLKDLEESN
jgi:hypothetical protein